jgi:hypothetical protein
MPQTMQFAMLLVNDKVSPEEWPNFVLKKRYRIG